jgi:hypothetical protein
MKPRLCPNCKKEIPEDHGFSFDEKLNMICGSCGKVVISVSWEKEPIPEANKYHYSTDAGDGRSVR